MNPLADRHDAFERACNYMTTRLDAPITLDDLEAAIGLCRRSLQYAFRQRCGLSPMQWLREQRLCASHALLCKAAAHAGQYRDKGAEAAVPSVTAVGLLCGFGNLGAFSAHYRRRFGEYPSETLRQALLEPVERVSGNSTVDSDRVRHRRPSGCANRIVIRDG
jgi:transcriptional regulator GlxA family with amidase domain